MISRRQRKKTSTKTKKKKTSKKTNKRKWYLLFLSFVSLPKLALWVTSTAHICCNHKFLEKVFENLKICWTVLWSQCFRLRLCRKYGTAGRRTSRPQNFQESPRNYQINVICEHLRTRPKLKIIHINTNCTSIQRQEKTKVPEHFKPGLLLPLCLRTFPSSSSCPFSHPDSPIWTTAVISISIIEDRWNGLILLFSLQYWFVAILISKLCSVSWLFLCIYMHCSVVQMFEVCKNLDRVSAAAINRKVNTKCNHSPLIVQYLPVSKNFYPCCTAAIYNM